MMLVVLLACAGVAWGDNTAATAVGSDDMFALRVGTRAGVHGEGKKFAF